MVSPAWLWSFRRAFSRRYTERTTIVCVGSSTTYGTGASSPERSWVNHLARRLDSTSRTYLADQPGWVFTGTTAALGAGLARRSRELAPGAVMTRQVGVCNALEVHYRRRGGPFVIQVDGVPQMQVTPSASQGDHFDGVATVTDLPLADHVVTIAANGSAPVAISAVTRFDTTHTNRLGVVGLGTPGTRAVDYSTPDLAMRSHNRALSTLDPAALIMMIGSNDYATQTDPDEYYLAMRAAVHATRSALRRPDVPTLLVHGHRRYFPEPTSFSWDDYAAALSAAADSLVDTAFLDLSGHYPATQGADATGLVDPDGVHLTDAGHAWVGDLIADRLLRPAGEARFTEHPAPLPDPAGLPGLVAAWDATTLTGTPGSEVDWAPRAGRETAILTASVGRRATLKPGGLAGHPTVVTTSGGRCLQTAPWATPVTGALTILAVVKPGTTPSAAPAGILFSGRSGRYTALNMIGDNLAQLLVGNTSGDGVVQTFFGAGAGGWKVLALTVQPAEGRVGLTLYGQGQQWFTVVPGQAYGLGGFTIGGNSGLINNLDGEFAELLVFDRELDAVETDVALRSLARRYALDGAGRTTS